MDYRIECIDEFEVLRYLGFKQFRPGELKKGLPEMTAQVEETLLEVRAMSGELKTTARPKGTFLRIPLTRKEDKFYLLDGNLELPGRSIANHLKDSSEVILISGTLGITVDQYLRKLELSDMKKAVMTDSIASVAIENILDQVQNEIRQTLKEGEFLTDRFAPGYGDLPISLNRTLAEILDTRRRIGLTVSGSGIMIPRKSIMAIIGVADREQPQFARGCSTCTMKKDCTYSKAVKK